LKKGDEIEIVRSGEVIPKFLQVVKSSKSQYQVPEVCPSCGEPIQSHDIRLICVNDKCPGKNKESILHFVQKIGIDDLSSKRLDQMIEKKMIATISDLYKLKKESLLELDKFKDKLADKILGNIEKSKEADLPTFLSALGISGGGYNKCEKVVQNGFDTIEKIKGLAKESLMEIDSFAEKSAEEFSKSLKEKIKLIEDLEASGFEFKIQEIADNPVKGKKICITGSLSRKRSEIEKDIRFLGGIVVSSVGKTTDFLLTNDTESSSSKFKKAQQLEIPIVDEAWLSQFV
ncbi:MAG: BRCT domain-containing protein, partial [Bacteriovoracaceae bacterium]